MAEHESACTGGLPATIVVTAERCPHSLFVFLCYIDCSSSLLSSPHYSPVYSAGVLFLLL